LQENPWMLRPRRRGRARVTCSPCARHGTRQSATTARISCLRATKTESQPTTSDCASHRLGLDRTIAVFEGQGDYASALEYANQCVRRDPLEEDGYRD